MGDCDRDIRVARPEQFRLYSGQCDDSVHFRHNGPLHPAVAEHMQRSGQVRPRRGIAEEVVRLVITGSVEAPAQPEQVWQKAEIPGDHRFDFAIPGELGDESRCPDEKGGMAGSAAAEADAFYGQPRRKLIAGDGTKHLFGGIGGTVPDVEDSRCMSGETRDSAGDEHHARRVRRPFAGMDVDDLPLGHGKPNDSSVTNV